MPTINELIKLKFKMTLFTMAKGEGGEVFTFEDFYIVDQLLDNEIKKRLPKLKLLPCTCGKKPERITYWYDHVRYHLYKCPVCDNGAKDDSTTDKDARIAWNKRVGEQYG